MARLSLLLLGALQITLDGRPLTGFESVKERALLAYLAEESHQPHRREALAGFLWSERTERAARNNLSRVLSNLRRLLGDRTPTGPPFLLVTRETVRFNPGCDAWIDSLTFADLLSPPGQQSSAQLEEAIHLYQGDFLEGFSVAGSPACEEWIVLCRERYQRLMREALHRLVDDYESRGRHDRALELAWKQLDLEPWWEEAHQGLIRLLALSGRRSEALAQYGKCRRLLVEELGVAPSADTTRLYEQIRDGELEPATGTQTPVRGLQPPSRHPGFLEPEAEPVEPPVFVARERELARLNAHLERALAGHGHVLFVTGGPGRGKTALLAEFGRRAVQAHPDLLVASGHCNAYSGIGDPYLPFRQIMALLTGDVEARWLAGAVSTAQARRLWNALPSTIQSLLQHGPHVTGPLIAGRPLLSRAALWCATAPAGPQSAGWLHRLRGRIERRRAAPEGTAQSHLFQQVTNLLRSLAESHPLVLVLDDLQWADTATIALLFHLGRQLEGARILITGAYRPVEVALGRPSTGSGQGDRHRRVPERHPLEQVLAEFKRAYGDVWLDLDREDEAEDRRFVDALLDTEPNELGEGFRRSLFGHTGGLPLFAIEVLRDLQERGDLRRDGRGRWAEGSALSWDSLPARVEGVIEERIGRLPEELRQALTVASVEGEQFTAQVVARVQKVQERLVLQQLSVDLGKRHRLVRELGEDRAGRRPLSRYRFAHYLFQHYLYKGLSAGERRLLHGEIGDTLEELFEDREEEIAVQLANHYRRAGLERRALPHLVRAGHQARARFANEEAVRTYSEALDIVPRDDPERFDLLACRAAVYSLVARRDEQRADVEAMLELAGELADEALLCDALLALADYRLATQHLDAQKPAERALEIARRLGDPLREGTALRRSGTLATMKGAYQQSRDELEAAVEILLDVGAFREAAICLNELTLTLGRLGEHGLAVATAKRAVALSREIGDRQQEATGLRRLAGLFLSQNQHAEALPLAQRALALHREVGDRSAEYSALNLLGIIQAHLGAHEEAEMSLQQSLHIAESIGSSEGTAHAAFNLVRLCYERRSDFEGCLQFLDLRLERAKAERAGYLVALLHRLSGRVLTHFGQYARAYRSLAAASENLGALGLLSIELDCRAYRGLVEAFLGDLEGSAATLQAAAERAREARLHGDLAWALCFRGFVDLQAGGVERQRAGLDRVQEGLALIPDGLAGYSWFGNACEIAAALHLALGETDKALARSKQGLRFMEAHPAPEWPERTHFTHSRILRALGQEAEADEHLQRAYARVMQVAGHTQDPELRRSWLENVQVNREILDASARRGISDV